MALLDDAIEASGGFARWNKLQRFTFHLSIKGALLSRSGRGREFEDLIAEGATHTQSVRFTGLTKGEKTGTYQPDSVTIENLDGQVLRTWLNPSLEFLDHASDPLADDLHLVFFCGFLIWNYLTTPFLLARPDVTLEELPPWIENDQRWRRLRTFFPSDIVTSSPEQIFYFDENSLQRRTDYDLLGTRVAHYSWAHQAFCGIVVPTLRRSLALQPDGTTVTKPILLDVEVLDATFE
jgi:hypothetical protein